MKRAVLVASLAVLLMPSLASAHALNPALLEIHERGDGAGADVLWKLPAVLGDIPNLRPVLPEPCRATTPPAVTPVSFGTTERWTTDCGPGGLAGKTITIAGESDLPIEILVRLSLADGRAFTAVLRGAERSVDVPASGEPRTGVASYLGLGVRHILGGFDHLLFVLGLLLLVRGRWRLLLGTITAFTLAHSLTLSLAVLGVVHVPPRAVEAVIALSILLLAVELAHLDDAEPTLTVRFPWAVAFTFGLLHGFGFAGALTELGLPPADVPMALLLFNVGVELGQLMFVAALLVLMRLARGARVKSVGRRLAPYAIGSVAAFLCIDRIVRIVALWS